MSAASNVLIASAHAELRVPLIRPTLVTVLDSSQIVKPAQSTSPLVKSSVGGWVGKVTERRAIRYGSLRGTKEDSIMRFYERASKRQQCNNLTGCIKL